MSTPVKLGLAAAALAVLWLAVRQPPRRGPYWQYMGQAGGAGPGQTGSGGPGPGQV